MGSLKRKHMRWTPSRKRFFWHGNKRRLKKQSGKLIKKQKELNNQNGKESEKDEEEDSDDENLEEIEKDIEEIEQIQSDIADVIGFLFKTHRELSIELYFFCCIGLY